MTTAVTDTPAGPAAQTPAGPGLLPSWFDVACPTWGCAKSGLRRRVSLRVVAPGVLEMPTLVCQHCGAAMARVVGPVDEGDEDDMAKITVHGGPSNAQVNPPTPDAPDTRVDPADGTRPLSGAVGGTVGQVSTPADEDQADALAAEALPRGEVVYDDAGKTEAELLANLPPADAPVDAPVPAEKPARKTARKAAKMTMPRATADGGGGA